MTYRMTYREVVTVMMSKAHPRAKGSGSVFQLPDGRWRAQLEAGFTRSGARRYLTRTRKSEKAAVQALRSLQLAVERDGISSASSTLTVRAWLDRWLPVYATQVRPSRWTDARGVIRRYIVPAIGSVQVGKLTPAHVRAVHGATRAAGFGPSTALRAHDVLMVALKAAQREGITVPSAVMLVERPRLGESDRGAIPVDDALEILRVAVTREDASRWVAALLQGMRQGECLGLTWECVDLDRGTVDVSWQLQRLPYLDRQAGTFRVPASYTHRQLVGAAHLVRPKSRAGHRVIPLVPWMRDALAQWQQVAPVNLYGLVWTEQGRPIRKVTDQAAWHDIQDAAQVAHLVGVTGRRYGIHEARHTTATLLLEAGVDPHTVTQILGHSSITTSRGYQHVSQALARRALEDVAARLQLGRGAG